MNCYAETMGKRLRAMALADQRDSKNPGRKAAYIDAIKPAGGWSGKLVTIPDALNDPFGWKKPQRIFVNSMSDLFHADVPFEFIDQVFAVMWDCHWHTFQVLTKRADRMREYFESEPIPRIAAWSFKQWTEREPAKSAQGIVSNLDIANEIAGEWPIPNVWLGVSVENQAMADKRIPDLLEIHAAVRFLSVEPLLSEVNLLKVFHELGYSSWKIRNWLSWVIVGGESGPNARPMHPDWARLLRDQCQAAGVGFFFKQWGEWIGWDDSCQYDRATHSEHWICYDGSLLPHEPSEEQAMSLGATRVIRPGKKIAGRMLDGRTWDEFPKVGE